MEASVESKSDERGRCSWEALVGTDTGVVKWVSMAKQSFENVGLSDRSCVTCVGAAWPSCGARYVAAQRAGLVHALSPPPCDAPVARTFACARPDAPADGLLYVAPLAHNVVTVFADGRVQLRHATSFDVANHFQAGAQVTAAHLLPSGRLLTGGREAELKVWDMTTCKAVFEAKNVKQNWVQLRRPVWVTGALALGGEEDICISTGYGELRRYDVRSGQRRPVAEIRHGEQPFRALASHADAAAQVFAGDSVGNVGLFDFGKKRLVHYYRGFAGAVSAIAASGDHLLTTSLDRFVRVHSIASRQLLSQLYVKSKPTSLLLTDTPIVLADAHAPHLPGSVSPDSHNTSSADRDDDVWRQLPTVDDVPRKRSKIEK